MIDRTNLDKIVLNVSHASLNQIAVSGLNFRFYKLLLALVKYQFLPITEKKKPKKHEKKKQKKNYPLSNPIICTYFQVKY